MTKPPPPRRSGPPSGEVGSGDGHRRARMPVRRMARFGGAPNGSRNRPTPSPIWAAATRPRRSDVTLTKEIIEREMRIWERNGYIEGTVWAAITSTSAASPCSASNATAQSGSGGQSCANCPIAAGTARAARSDTHLRAASSLSSPPPWRTRRDSRHPIRRASAAVRPASAQSCGLPPLPPLPPLGCHRLEPVCYCDAYGHCRWSGCVSASHGATAH